MANPERTSTSQKGLGFFAPNELKTSVVKQGQFKPQWVHVGEGVSTCFIAVAASLLDKLATGHVLNEPVLKTILKKHKKLFPEQMAAKGAAFSTQDRIELLQDNVKTGVLTQSLARTLLELTNDAINHEPAHHALYLVSEQKSKEAIQFRLAVMAKALNIQIDLHEKTQDKNIAQKSRFGLDGKLTITLLLHHNTVFPQIKQPKRVSRLQKMGTPDYEQLEITVRENSLFVMQNALDNILEVYDKEKNALQLMVQAGELSDEKLVTLYSQMLTLAIEQSTSSFVGPIMDSREMVQAITQQKSGYFLSEENISDTKDLVIESIASMVGLKKADIELAFEQVEINSDTVAKPGV